MRKPIPLRSQHLRLAALYAVLSSLSFAVMGACVKWSAPQVGANMTVFLRCVFGLLFLWPFLRKALRSQGWSSLATQDPLGHFWRVLFGLSAMYCFFYALGHLPLAEAMLLNYTTPIFIPFFAWLWLGEKPPWMIWPAVLIGLVGVALIVKPSAALLTVNMASAVGLLSGILASLAMTSIRKITAHEPSRRVVFWFSVNSVVVSTITILFDWQTPPWSVVAVMVLGGLAATLGQLSLTKAYSLASAAHIGAMTYVVVVFGALIGWAIWHEALDRWTLLGGLCVVITAVMAGSARRKAQ